MHGGGFAFFALLGLAALGTTSPSAQQPVGTISSAVVGLRPTDHPPLPDDPSQFWMTPTKANTTWTPALDAFASAIKLEADGQFAKALPILSQPLLGDHALGEYVQYYKGLAELSVGRTTDARATFQALTASGPAGYLREAAALREAESDEALGDYSAALGIYERLLKAKVAAPDDVLIKMGMAARAAGDLEKALSAFSRAYYEFPLSDLSPAADLALDRLPNRPPIAAGSQRFTLELGRAEQLFGAKQYSQARAAFARLRGAAQGDDLELVNLRVAESDYFLKQRRAARDGVKPYIQKASRRQGEALFFYAVALYGLGDRDEYFRVVRRIADDFPTETWSEEALNHLATHFIVDDRVARADETFREMYARFPGGRYAERAAWKIGWLAYRNQQYADTIRVFESAAARFPRSDYRPPWLYWSAKAYEALKEPGPAQARYALVANDYFSSYYGRLAVTHLDGATRPQLVARGPAAEAARPPGAAADGEGEDIHLVSLPPNEQLVRALVGLGLYDQATSELRYAQRVWVDSPAIRATLAWIYQKQGQSAKGSQQFTLYRASINTMKRAYPQYLTVGGDRLPRDVLRLIFPLEYWDLIRKYAAAHQFDPYFVAALVAQESTFVADIRSPARAVGLMQLLPSTGRRYAKKLKMPYSARLLTNPDASIKMGTAYLADTIREFGELHLVLASYNAGESRVRRWVAERPGLPRDEFIEEIPFPETQNYVKRILGTAEDYRRLYAGESGN